jgi:ribose 5-phosphate isomerase B
MKISIGADHGAYELREALVKYLRDNGHDVIDHGTHKRESVDYPDYAHMVGVDIQEGRAQFGILMCTSGIGMCISANKMNNVRAAHAHYEDDAFYSRRHNNANVICFGQKHTTIYDAIRCTYTFIHTDFEGGRHARRVDKFEQSCRSC